MRRGGERTRAGRVRHPVWICHTGPDADRNASHHPSPAARLSPGAASNLRAPCPVHTEREQLEQLKARILSYGCCTYIRDRIGGIESTTDI